MTSRQHGNKLQRFLRLEGRDKGLLLSAIGWLLVARVRLVVTPFDKLANDLSAKTGGSSKVTDPELLERIGFAVSAAANNVPWRSDCFPQAIAAGAMLKRRGHDATIHLGVEKTSPDSIAGHAWLTCGDKVVTGGANLDRYTEIHRFP